MACIGSEAGGDDGGNAIHRLTEGLQVASIVGAAAEQELPVTQDGGHQLLLDDVLRDGHVLRLLVLLVEVGQPAAQNVGGLDGVVDLLLVVLQLVDLELGHTERTPHGFEALHHAAGDALQRGESALDGGHGAHFRSGNRLLVRHGADLLVVGAGISAKLSLQLRRGNRHSG
jgi:hypothetical protein